MSVEFIGHVGARAGSDVLPASGPVLDKAYIRQLARIAEDSGLDRLLIGQFATWPDNNHIAGYVLHQTERLGVMLAHRTGFVAPTLAARQLATLDHLSEGRLAVHIISGGTDEDQQRDGDWLAHDERYARTDEYLDLLDRVWRSEQPFDHEGRFYRLKGAFSNIKPFNGRRVPVFFGGASDAAVAVAGRHADSYALWGEPLDSAAEIIGRVRAAAAAVGRRPRFLLAFRPIIEATEGAAWDRAARILEQVQAAQRGAPPQPMNAGSVRLRDAAARGKVLDRRLWTELAAASGAGGNSTALVGTADQVAEALLDYHALGVDQFLIRGFDPPRDTERFGREVAPRVRAALAARAASLSPASAPVA